MTEQELIKQLIAKKNEYEKEDQGIFDSWIEQLENAQITKELGEHFAVKELLKSFKAEIEAINEKLLNDLTLDTFTRLHLIDRRELFNKFVGIFNLADLTNQIKKELNI
jgi:hypothetical protein